MLLSHAQGSLPRKRGEGHFPWYTSDRFISSLETPKLSPMSTVSATPPPAYPFAAIVGQQQMREALCLLAVDPRIGGVIIRGAKGSAKTTAVRGMAPLLGEAQHPVVELPLGATEDRVVGSLDLAAVLESSDYQFQPGLLSQADGGVLYVDEINLLKDHLVDVLLDAAATGFVHVERDGLSHTARTSFILVGTMNPEEGELRPQLLDRFGFSVESEPVSDPAQRVEIVRRRLAYDADPIGFAKEWENATSQLRTRLHTARELLPRVEISDEVVLRIARIATQAGVDGLRADVVMTRAARAHAAWVGRTTVTDDDVREAALLALPHRRHRAPFDPPQMSEDQISDLLQASAQPQTHPSATPPPPSAGGSAATSPKEDPVEAPTPNDNRSPEEQGESPRPFDESGRTTTSLTKDSAPAPITAAAIRTDAQRLRHQLAAPTVTATGGGAGSAYGQSDRGYQVRAVDFLLGQPLHPAATITEAVISSPTAPRVEGKHLRSAETRGTRETLVVFVLDTSGSMAARTRISAVRTLMGDILTDAYQHRDKVALIDCQGAEGREVLPPTRSLDRAAAALDTLTVGGRTPLAGALRQAISLLHREHAKDDGVALALVILTDGRATVSTHPGYSPREETLLAARQLRGLPASTLVVDCEEGRIRLGLARHLAEAAGARCISLASVTDYQQNRR